MTSRVKFYPEELKRYLLAHPNMTREEIAEAFSGTLAGLTTALNRHRIKLKSIPGRVFPYKYSKEDLENYLSAHPEAQAKEIAQFFNTSIGTVRVSARRYGIVLPKISRGRRKTTS